MMDEKWVMAYAEDLRRLTKKQLPEVYDFVYHFGHPFSYQDFEMTLRVFQKWGGWCSILQDVGIGPGTPVNEIRIWSSFVALINEDKKKDAVRDMEIIYQEDIRKRKGKA